MGELLIFIGLVLFVVGLFKLLYKKSKTAKKTKWLIFAAGIVLMIAGTGMTGNSSVDKDTNTDASIPSQSSSSAFEIKQSIVDELKNDLQAGDAEAFMKTYYAQPRSAQGLYYDKADVYNTTTKVNGTAFQTNSNGSRLYVYVPVEAPKSGWDNITNTKQNAYVVIVKAADGTFSDANVGKNITVEGQLQSRGDLNLGYNWDLANATIVD